MKQKKKVPLFLEPLEDRWVPATVRYLGGTLIVSNPSVTSGTSSLKLQFDSTNHVAVTDGTHGNGSYTVGGNILVLGNNAKETINVDLANQTFTGNLFINTGNGNDTAAITSTGGTGAISGNVTIIAGNGNDSINLNADGSAASMTIGGSVNVTTLYGNETFTLGNGTTATSVGGNVTLTNPSVVKVGVGSADVIGGNLSIGSTLVSTGVNVTVTGITLQGNFTVTGGTGNDTVTVNSSNILGSVNENLSTAAGVGADVVSFGTTRSIISGNLNVQAGAASTTFTTGTSVANWLVVQGNAYFNFGDNNNAFLPDATGGDINVFGNLQITEGNGNDTVLLGATNGAGASRVGGNLIVNLGNGTDSVVVNGTVGGTVQAHLGNGNDTLVLGDGLASDSANYNGFAVFGNGSDSLALGTFGLVSGSYIGGTNPNNNFSQSYGLATATLSPFFQLINFP